MSWFEKMGLVEREATESVESENTEEVPVESEVNAVIEDTDNIVEDIFNQNDLSRANGDSIYMVESLMATLPEVMPTAQKIATVSSSLAVFGKDIQTLINDANSRIAVLTEAKDKVISERSSEIAQSNEEIEALKQAIDQANLCIKNAEDIVENTKKHVEDEVARINNLLKFCADMSKENK